MWFFVRNKNETHSILLWKKTNNEIIIFEPNNLDFSKFVVTLLQSLSTGFNFRHCILISSIPIYKYIGPFGKERDCTNICIVMGSELIELHKKHIPLNIMEETLINNITNQKRQITDITLKNNFCSFDGSSFREHHSSDRQQRIKFLNSIGAISNIIDGNFKFKNYNKSLDGILTMTKNMEDINNEFKINHGLSLANLYKK